MIPDTTIDNQIGLDSYHEDEDDKLEQDGPDAKRTKRPQIGWTEETLFRLYQEVYNNKAHVKTDKLMSTKWAEVLDSMIRKGYFKDPESVTVSAIKKKYDRDEANLIKKYDLESEHVDLAYLPRNVNPETPQGLLFTLVVERLQHDSVKKLEKEKRIKYMSPPSMTNPNSLDLSSDGQNQNYMHAEMTSSEQLLNVVSDLNHTLLQHSANALMEQQQALSMHQNNSSYTNTMSSQSQPNANVLPLQNTYINKQNTATTANMSSSANIEATLNKIHTLLYQHITHKKYIDEENLKLKHEELLIKKEELDILKSNHSKLYEISVAVGLLLNKTTSSNNTNNTTNPHALSSSSTI